MNSSRKLAPFLILLLACDASAIDLGYRYGPTTRKCRNAGRFVGKNTGGEGIECADFSNARYSGASFSGARLLGADFSMPLPEYCGPGDLCQTYYQDKVDFSGVDGRGLVTQGNGFINVNFARAILEQANLSSTIITSRGKLRSTFEGADLKKADLRRMQASQTKFDSVDLRGADLRGATFADCTFEGAVFDQYTRLPFSKETAFQLQMEYVYTPEEIPLDLENVLTPPVTLPIQDDRIFGGGPDCGTNADSLRAAINDCQAVLGVELTLRSPLAWSGESDWRLVTKDASGTLWVDSETSLMIWRPSPRLATSVRKGKAACAALTSKPLFRRLGMKSALPKIDDFREWMAYGFRSLFPETRLERFWTSTGRDPSSDIYHFFHGPRGSTAYFDDGDDAASIVCVVTE